jgi:hypothetical protein
MAKYFGPKETEVISRRAHEKTTTISRPQNIYFNKNISPVAMAM